MNPLLAPIEIPIRIVDNMTRVVSMAERAVALLESLDDKADRMLSIAEDLDAQANRLIALGERMEKIGTNVEGLGGEIVRAAAAVNESALRLLPTVEQAVVMAGPLEGAVERLGRVVDRLPGASKTTKEKRK